MKGFRPLNISSYAVSEVIASLLLVLIAVAAFSIIYLNFNVPEPNYETPVKIWGEVDNEGSIVLHHEGGMTLNDYTIIARFESNGTLIGSKEIKDNTWSIGMDRYPLEDIGQSKIKLLNETHRVRIDIYLLYEDGTTDSVFSGVLQGKISEGDVLPPSEGDSMLISSLQTDTTDEDLICFNYSVEPTIDALTFIYNWLVDGNSITDILLPFDTNSTINITDYSGDFNNGTNNGATWIDTGLVGGGYQFDGSEDYITLPYCYDASYVDEITIETWIKTSSDSGVIASFERETLFELLVDQGVLRWFTYADGDTSNIIGTIRVDDNTWHHIAATYSFSTGESSIYVDGVLDKIEEVHNPLDWLGTGSTPNGLIGITNSGPIPGSWEILTYDDFEDGFGNYTDGGRDCILYTGEDYAHQGDNAANIQDNNWQYSSFYYPSGLDVHSSGYTSIKVDFWFYAREMENWEDFWVRYYDGSDWYKVADYDCGDEFENGQFYHENVWINESSYTFPTNMRIRFQCDASSDYDDIYIDQVYVNVSGGQKEVDDFSGEMDEFKIYNIALSGEQIYQNYLCEKDGLSNKRVILSDETSVGDIWSCIVTPNDSTQDDEATESNNLQIIGYGGGI